MKLYVWINNWHFCKILTNVVKGFLVVIRSVVILLVATTAVVWLGISWALINTFASMLMSAQWTMVDVNTLVRTLMVATHVHVRLGTSPMVMIVMVSQIISVVFRAANRGATGAFCPGPYTYRGPKLQTI